MTAWIVYLAALAAFGLLVALLGPVSRRLWGADEEAKPPERGRPGR